MLFLVADIPGLWQGPASPRMHLPASKWKHTVEFRILNLACEGLLPVLLGRKERTLK